MLIDQLSAFTFAHRFLLRPRDRSPGLGGELAAFPWCLPASEWTSSAATSVPSRHWLDALNVGFWLFVGLFLVWAIFFCR